MREVLNTEHGYVYLNPAAAELLAHARRVAVESEVLTDSLFPLSRGRTLWFTWAGTNTQITLAALLAAEGVNVVNRDVAIELRLPKREAYRTIARLASSEPDPRRIAAVVQPKLRRKYDYLLSDQLLDAVLMRDVLDLEGAVRVCRRHVQRGAGQNSRRQRGALGDGACR